MRSTPDHHARALLRQVALASLAAGPFLGLTVAGNLGCSCPTSSSVMHLNHSRPGGSPPPSEASPAGDEAAPPADPPSRLRLCMGAPFPGDGKEGPSESPPTCVNEARRAHAAGDHATALRCFAMLYALNPRPELLFNAGVLRREMGERDRARVCFELAIEHADGNETVRRRAEEALAAP